VRIKLSASVLIETIVNATTLIMRSSGFWFSRGVCINRPNPPAYSTGMVYEYDWNIIWKWHKTAITHHIPSDNCWERHVLELLIIPVQNACIFIAFGEWLKLNFNVLLGNSISLLSVDIEWHGRNESCWPKWPENINWPSGPIFVQFDWPGHKR
jgi:hypothetical protein